MQDHKNSVIFAILGILLLVWPAKSPAPPSSLDLPAKAFDSYEKLWRELAKQAADKLDAGELKTDQEAWNFLAQGQEPARRIAFQELAKTEQERFDKEGGWTPALHSKILREYAK